MLQNQENWASINNYLNYQISTHGRVRNANSGKIMKSYTRDDGYQTIPLCENGIRKNHRIHRLVAEAFIPNPNNYPCIDHIDRSRVNNNYNNLRWVTNAMNSKNRSKQSNNSSGITGVSFDNKSNKWRAEIRVNGMHITKRFYMYQNAVSFRKQLELQYGFTNE